MQTNNYRDLQDQCIADVNSGKHETTFVVTLSKCSMAAGAGEVLSAIQCAVAEEHIPSADVTVTGCGGLCHAEPIVTVKKPGKPDVVYSHVTPLKAYSIVVAHGLYSQTILPWVFNK